MALNIKTTFLLHADGKNIDISKPFAQGVKVISAKDTFVGQLSKTLSSGVEAEGLGKGKTISLYSAIKTTLTYDTDNHVIDGNGYKFQTPASIEEITKIGEYAPMDSTNSVLLDNVDTKAVGFPNFAADKVVNYMSGRIVLDRKTITNMMVTAAKGYKLYNNKDLTQRASQPAEAGAASVDSVIGVINSGRRWSAKITQAKLYEKNAIYNIVKAIKNYALKIGVVNEKFSPFIEDGARAENLIIVATPDVSTNIEADGISQLINLPGGITKQVKSIEGIPIYEDPFVESLTLGGGSKGQFIVVDKTAWFRFLDKIKGRTVLGTLKTGAQIGAYVVNEKGTEKTKNLRDEQGVITFNFNAYMGEQLPGLTWVIGSTN